MKPQYRTTIKTFIAPHTIEAGSVIETTAEPSLTWEPLNEAAESEMEKLYTKKYTHIDDKGNTVETQPHLNKRPQEIVNPNADRPTVELISNPPPNRDGELSLAESKISRAEPDLVPRGDGTSGLNIPTDRKPTASPATTNTDPVEPGAESVDGSTTILAPAPPPKLI